MYASFSQIKPEEDLEDVHMLLLDDEEVDLNDENDLCNKHTSRRRTLRSHRSSDSSSNGTSDGSVSKIGSSRFVFNKFNKII